MKAWYTRFVGEHGKEKRKDSRDQDEKSMRLSWPPTGGTCKFGAFFTIVIHNETPINYLRSPLCE
ncbi:hypothetical protein AGMMS49546_07760 [Spirochaetia bacterium]|nr:hypothetical protein AGMMS49546_07760 [Spirochaetia bacterium]